ncbi:unnamed protein product [Mycena citricolor]|uniref:Uncharacterized protein n=1 Tax=Mycena citricolor TaxID=2018698 RepID=A0AAD2HU99_9AGAR|nr:unnamed protein product [Mycena citricolor]
MPTTPTPASPSTLHHTTGTNNDIIGTVMLDKLTKEFNLGPPEIEHLRLFVRLGSLQGGLATADLATRLCMFAGQQGDVAERRRIHEAEVREGRDHRSILRDLEQCLNETFILTAPQRNNIRSVILNLVLDPKRTSYSNLYNEALAELKAKKDKLELDNVFNIPARLKKASSSIKNQCSSVRNGLRVDLIDGVHPNTFCELGTFVADLLLKYKGLVIKDQAVLDPFNVHLALLCRFVFDNPQLITTAKENEDDDNQGGYEESEESRPRKRKAKSGRTAKGQCFWDRVEEYLAKQIAIRGKNFASPEWKRYINQIVKDDQAKFRGLKPGSPVLDNCASSEECGSEGATAPAPSGLQADSEFWAQMGSGSPLTGGQLLS